jgi:hypothetical protein
MICSSLHLDRFIVRPLPAVGLYPNLEELQGLRSECISLNGRTVIYLLICDLEGRGAKLSDLHRTRLLFMIGQAMGRREKLYSVRQLS